MGKPGEGDIDMEYQSSKKGKQISETEGVRRKDEREQEPAMEESMFQNFPGGYYRCAADEGFSFLYMNDRFLDILGWTKEEIKEKFDNKFANLVHPDDQGMMKAYVEKKYHRFEKIISWIRPIV